MEGCRRTTLHTILRAICYEFFKAKKKPARVVSFPSLSEEIDGEADLSIERRDGVVGRTFAVLPVGWVTSVVGILTLLGSMFESEGLERNGGKLDRLFFCVEDGCSHCCCFWSLPTPLLPLPLALIPSVPSPDQ